VKKITYTGILAALTFVATAFVKIPLANQGYIHAGNIIIVITACLLGPTAGAAAGTIGSVFADLSYAPVWIPYTAVIKFLLGCFVGIGYKKPRALSLLLYFAAGAVFVGGYYLAEAIIIGNWTIPAASTPALLAEYAISLPVGIFVAKIMEKYKAAF
jgi:uncharacterized membrane protein